MMKLSRSEMETIIRGSAADQTWSICTADPRIIRKLAKQGYQPDGATNPWGYVSFTVPFDRVALRKAEKSKRGFALGDKTRSSVRATHTNAVSEG